MRWIVQFVAAAAAIALVWWLIRPRPVFVIRIREGRAELDSGEAPDEFVEDCRRIARDCRIADGAVTGYRRSGHVTLKFAGQVDPSEHQRFRNAWNFHA